MDEQYDDIISRNSDQFIDRTRTVEEDQPEYTVDEMDAEIQRGLFKRPQFFGDQSTSSSHSAFSSGASIAAGISSMVGSIASDLVDSRSATDTYRLTKSEFKELQKVAKSIAGYGNIPEDVVQDFLVILCYIDNINDMRTIADAVQVSELDNASIIRQPLMILSISHLYKIAFLASAVEGLINMFRRYLAMANNSDSGGGDSLSSVLGTLQSVLGLFSGGGGAARLNNGGVEDALGNFMSELITGKRIPMTIIAKNPNLQPPSYSGKAFFGESPAALSNVDIDQLFNKKIACFLKPSSGAGSTSFSFQNSSMFSGSMSVANLASKMMFGSSDVTAGSKKERQLQQITDKVSALTGAAATELIDIRRADTAVPMMQAMCAVASGTDKPVYPTEVFSNGWVLSNSVCNYLQNISSSYLEAIRKFG